MAALPAFRLNMITKVINAGTGEVVPEAAWVGAFTSQHPVTVQFQDGSYIIWNKDQVIFNQDVLERVKMSFAEFVCTVEKLRNVREQEKALKAELKGFYYKKPETIGDLIKQQLAQQKETLKESGVAPKDALGLPTMVDLSTLVVGDVVKLRDGSYVYVDTIKQHSANNTYGFSINNTNYKHNGAYYVTGDSLKDIVQIIKKGAKLLSNAHRGALVLSECADTPWVIKSINKLQKQDDVYAVYFEGGEMDLYKDNGTSYDNNTSSIVLL